MRQNRVGIPNEIKSTEGREFQSSETFWEKSKGDLSLTSYISKTSKGKKNVLVLTSTRPLQGVTKDDGKKKPAIIKLYDFTKGGTDVVDQRMGSYSCKMKSCKWTLVAFSYILDTTRVNAQTIHALKQNKDPKATDSFDFGWSLAEALIGPHVQRRSKVGLKATILMKMSFIEGPVQPAAPVSGDRVPLRHQTPRRCATCLLEIAGPNYKEKKDKLKKVKTQCQVCSKALCLDHMVARCQNCV